MHDVLGDRSPVWPRRVWSQTLAAAQAAPPEDTLDFYASAPELRAYVDAALEGNPTVLESDARYRAASRRVPQVTALPDPVVSFTQALRLRGDAGGARS